MTIITPIVADQARETAEAGFRLENDGYCILRSAMPSGLPARLDGALGAQFEATPLCRGDFYGECTKRLGSLLARVPSVATLVEHPMVLALAHRVLGPWADTIQLNLTQAIEIQSGALPQIPHRDQDMWRGDTGRKEYLLNVMWPLTPFRESNGATLLWPDSHGQAALKDGDPGKPVAVECDPGDAILFLGSTLHGAGGNREASSRRAILISYCLGWLKPYENQWLAYPPEVARHFSPDLAALVGYQQHRPNLGNYEGQCPSILLRERSEPSGAVDALRPDQAALLADYVAQQRQDLLRPSSTQ